MNVADLALSSDLDEVVAAFGKLTSLGKIKAYSNGIALTAGGIGKAHKRAEAHIIALLRKGENCKP